MENVVCQADRKTVVTLGVAECNGFGSCQGSLGYVVLSTHQSHQLNRMDVIKITNVTY